MEPMKSIRGGGVVPLQPLLSAQEYYAGRELAVVPCTSSGQEADSVSLYPNVPSKSQGQVPLVVAEAGFYPVADA